MHYGDHFVLANSGSYTFAVMNVPHHERSPSNEVIVACGEIVVTNGQIACFRYILAAMRSNIAGPAGNQDRRFVFHARYPTRGLHLVICALSLLVSGHNRGCTNETDRLATGVPLAQQ